MKALLFQSRVLATLRRYCPSLFLIPGLILGQLLSYYFGPFSGQTLGILVILAALGIYLRLMPFISSLSLLLGLLSSANLVSEPEILIDEKSYYVTVHENPRYPQPGGIRFIAEIQAEVEFQELSQQLHYREISGHPKVICKAIMLPWRNSVGIKPGTSFILKADFKKILKPLNLFTWESHLRRNDISYFCKARFTSEPVTKIDLPLTVARQKFESNIRSVFGDSEQAGLLLSLSIGTRDVLSDRLERAFKNTGLAHLLVVSGYQVTLVFVFSCQMLAHIFSRMRHSAYLSQIVRVAALLCCALFVAVLGWDQASLRACIALCLLVVAQCLAKGSSLGNILAATFLLTQVLWPLSIFDPGVELTFMALLGMLCLLPAENCSKFRKLLLVSFGATFFTSTISIFWFGTLSIWGFLLNPMIAPVLSFLGCHGTMLSYAVYEVGLDSQGYLLKLLAAVLWQFTKIVQYFSGVDSFSWRLEGLEQFLFGTMFMSATIAFIMAKLRRWSLSLNLTSS